MKSDFLSCDQCSYIGTKLRNLEEKHKRSQHDGVRYKCDQCIYKGTQKAPSMPTNDLFMRVHVMNVTSVVMWSQIWANGKIKTTYRDSTQRNQ